MTKSIWEDFPLQEFDSVSKDKVTDVCIIGTGIGGLTAAYILSRHDLKVTVVGAGTFGQGETSRSTAQINTMHDDSWVEMERLHGEEGIRKCAESYASALEFIDNVVHNEKIECGFEYVSSYLFAADLKDKDSVENLQQEYEAALRAGMKNVFWHEKTPLNVDLGPCIEFGRQAQFHPRAYLKGLTDSLARRPNVEFYTDSRVVELEEKNGKVRLTLENNSVITALKVIVATNVPFHKLLIPIEALAAYRSYVVAVEIPHGAIPFGQYWDNADPYHYVRLLSSSLELKNFNANPDMDILLIGGEDHRVGVMKDVEAVFERLYQWGKERFPISKNIVAQWSAQTIETFDGMPLLGRTASDGNIFIITGDSGMGITHATLGGLLTAGFASDKEMPWADLYDPKRSRANSMKRWISENLTSAAQYKDWVTPDEVHSFDEIQVGEGAIVRCGAHKVAACKDASGSLTKLSAVCTHLGGVVRWNPIEKTWDCPVHGSRFSRRGKVVNCPAATGLDPEPKEGE